MTEDIKQEVQKTEKKKIILSGIQPTGIFTLGNYIGAVRNWQQLQEDYQCAYFIADLHSLTVRQEAAKLRKQSLEAFARRSCVNRAWKRLPCCWPAVLIRRKALCLSRAMCTTTRSLAGFLPATPSSGSCPA